MRRILFVSMLITACSDKPGQAVVQTASLEGVAAASQDGALTIEPAHPMRRFIKVEPVHPRANASVAQVTGRIGFDEDRTSRVASPISGRIASLLVKPGDHVSKGQPLLTILSPEVDAALAEQRNADADFSLAEHSLERMRSLFELSAVAKKEVAAAENDVIKSRSARDAARAKLSLLGLAPNAHSSSFTLRAPIAGVVVERAALPGAEVRADAATPLVTLSNLDRVWILADVYERDLSLVTAGEEAEFQVASYPAQSFKARVAHVNDTVDSESRTVKVRLAADNADGKLKPEMFARITLHLPSAEGMLTVPSQAVLTDGEANMVIVCMDDRRFEKRRVVAVGETGGEVRISSGLRAGERVVTEGALFLRSEIENR